MSLITRRNALIGAASLLLAPAHAQFGGQPYWAFPNSYIDIDFANLRIWGANFVPAAAGFANGYPGVIANTTSGSTVVYLPDRTGLLIQQAGNITRWTSGMGIWSYTSYSNVCLQNRTLTNAVWAATTMTVTKNTVSADGIVNGAFSITATAANATLIQAITAASAAYVASCDVKRLSGSGTLQMTVDGGTTWTTVPVTGSYAQVSIPAQTLANPSIGFRVVTLGDSFAIDFIHCNSNANGLTALNPARCVSTTVAITVFNEEPEFNTSVSKPNDGFRIVKDIIVRGAPWSGYFENSGNAALGCANVLPDAGNGFFIGGAGGDAGLQGTATTSNTGNFGLGNWNRGALSLNGQGNKICLNGGPVATGTTQPSAPAIGTTHLGIGNSAASTIPLNGATRRVTLWQYEQPSGFLQEITRLPA